MAEHQVYTTELPMLSGDEKTVDFEHTFENSELSNRYILTPFEAKKAADAAKLYGKSEENVPKAVHIQRAVRDVCPNALGELAAFIPAKFCMDDLVLKKETHDLLALLISHVKNKRLVNEEWGFEEKMPYGGGISVMFYGPPGTGKTMSAQVLSHELNLDLYRIDLSQMVSKYIGETQKNISELFKKAKNLNAILFFDEADALFSQRGEVSSSNDRHANSEVAHLLQQFENYDGITILATNLMSHLDPAFKRRIKYMVAFELPNLEERIRLWNMLLPEKTPRGENLDLTYFAENYELAGSAIKEILWGAAHLAASQGRSLFNSHIAQMLKINIAKTGRIVGFMDCKYLG